MQPSEARGARISLQKVLKTLGGAFFCLFVGLSILVSAQDLDNAPSSVLARPGWNYGVQISGGSTVVQASAPLFVTSDRAISNLAVAFHFGRVLTHEHGRGWIRGTFEWGANSIPFETFWVLGSHYAGGFEVFGPRWNFTNNRRRAVPFVGLSGGMLFSSNSFPPGDTSRTNFTGAIDAGAHLFLSRHPHSFDVTSRVQHVSNAYLGRSNPGVPLSLQLTVGYSWY
jgi:Lipid A 3-O-deacylase (PagL)